MSTQQPQKFIVHLTSLMRLRSIMCRSSWLPTDKDLATLLGLKLLSALLSLPDWQFLSLPLAQVSTTPACKLTINTQDAAIQGEVERFLVTSMR